MDTHILACRPVESLTPEEAARTGSVRDFCRHCRAEVWVVPGNLVLLEEGAVLLCVPCAARVAEMDAMCGGAPLLQSVRKATPVFSSVSAGSGIRLAVRTRRA